jgi:hypothetical protein
LDPLRLLPRIFLFLLLLPPFSSLPIPKWHLACSLVFPCTSK